MRLVTWNVNSLRARMPRVVEFLEAHAPDVLCLQEIKCSEEQLPHLDLQASGYRVVAYPGGPREGVAVLVPADQEVGNVRCGLPDEPDPGEARWIEVEVGDLTVGSVYVPNGREVGSPTYEAKLAFLDALRARFAELSSPLVVAGDFNVAPTDADVWDPDVFDGATHVTEPERERFGALLETGLVDAFRAVEPDTRQFTWWDYRGGSFHKNEGMRIDAVLATPDIDVGSCGIVRDFRKGKKPSDHAPLLAELALPEGANRG
ncbi:exodeoxyribonuclease III [Egibacter rhizosphaerae]|uniref:Exodeoxyribonuclease III n=1 Tax=Egibacter rhizosphaerae TaxID=1670831 RepID=A0A411YBR1_9ACTN|nr:exodeoxyribonuclease III [Egibacter rhizosphaerae]QBI18626.1 exodeoxyribonuclease III [Egibacter rhizosphaerae]